MASKKKRDAVLKPEFIFPKAKSNQYLAALRKIGRDYGRITPRLVVQEAKQEDHPLNEIFKFDDVEGAAERWWLHRARSLINHYRTNFLGANGKPRPKIPQIPLFYSNKAIVTVVDDDGNETDIVEDVYDELDSILANPHKQAQVIDEGIKAFRSLLNRYRPWQKEFKEMYPAYTEMMRRIRNKK